MAHVSITHDMFVSLSACDITFMFSFLEQCLCMMLPRLFNIIRYYMQLELSYTSALAVAFGNLVLSTSFPIPLFVQFQLCQFSYSWVVLSAANIKIYQIRYAVNFPVEWLIRIIIFMISTTQVWMHFILCCCSYIFFFLHASAKAEQKPFIRFCSEWKTYEKHFNTRQSVSTDFDACSALCAPLNVLLLHSLTPYSKYGGWN